MTLNWKKGAILNVHKNAKINVVPLLKFFLNFQVSHCSRSTFTFFCPKMLISENNTSLSCQMANFVDFRALLNKNGQMIDWIVTKFLIIAQDVIKLHSNKNFNVFSLGILKCVSFWRRHIFYQKVFICPSMMHKHFMVLKKLGREQDIFF